MFTHPLPTNLKTRRIPVGFIAELGPLRIAEVRIVDATDSHLVAKVHRRSLHQDQPWLPEAVFEMARRLIQDEILDHAEVTLLNVGSDFDIAGFTEALPFLDLSADLDGDGTVTAAPKRVDLGVVTEATVQMALKVEGISVTVGTDNSLTVEFRMDVDQTATCSRILDFDAEERRRALDAEIEAEIHVDAESTIHEELSEGILSIDESDLTPPEE